MHRAPDPRRQQPLYTYTHTCIPLLAIQFPVITSMNCSFNTDISQRYNITARSRHSKFLAARAYTYCLSFSLSLISLPPILLSSLSRKLLRVAGSNPCSRVTAISRRGYRVRPPRSFARIFHPAAERLTVSVCMLHARGPKLPANRASAAADFALIAAGLNPACECVLMRIVCVCEDDVLTREKS